MQPQLIYSPEVWEGVLGKDEPPPVTQLSRGLDRDDVGGVMSDGFSDDDEVTVRRFLALTVNPPGLAASLQAPSDIDDLQDVRPGGGAEVDLGADDQVGVEKVDEPAQQVRSPLLRVGAMLSDLANEAEGLADEREAQLDRVWFHAAALYRIIDDAEHETGATGP